MGLFKLVGDLVTLPLDVVKDVINPLDAMEGNSKTLDKFEEILDDLEETLE